LISLLRPWRTEQNETFSYSPELEASALTKTLPANTISRRGLSQQEGISQMPLSKWQSEALTKGMIRPGVSPEA
jgi:hypothetical protein